jgi:hypothetical protein
MLTVLSPYAATGIETCGVVRCNRSAAGEIADKNVCFARPQWRKDGGVFTTSALDNGYRCHERDKRYSGNPQNLSRNEIGAH